MLGFAVAFWRDDRGTASASDWIFLTSILVIAILPCMMGARERLRQRTIRKPDCSYPAIYKTDPTPGKQ